VFIHINLDFVEDEERSNPARYKPFLKLFHLKNSYISKYLIPLDATLINLSLEYI
jgi:hypothetical protein